MDSLRSKQHQLFFLHLVALLYQHNVILGYYFSDFTFCCLQVALVVEEHLLNRVAPAQAVRGGLAHVDADLGHRQVPPLQLLCLLGSMIVK